MKRKHSEHKRKKLDGAALLSSLMLLAAAGVFLYAMHNIWQIYDGYKAGEEEYQLVADEVVLEESTQEEEKITIDFAKLWEINPDVVAWIRFEEPAIINYPVVQGKDNDEYLTRTFKGYDNTCGTIFVNAMNQPDFSDRNTIIYGHYMNNGTMFNELEKYQDEAFWKAHPYFYLYTPDEGECKYEIYAAGVVEDVSEGYTFQFGSDEEFEAFLEATIASSAYDTGIIPGGSDKVVTLSTCTKEANNQRNIIHAVKAKES